MSDVRCVLTTLTSLVKNGKLLETFENQRLVPLVHGIVKDGV